MSDNEEESYCFYGKPLDPYDEDLFPKKRPITVEEQIATDEQGRRRFHGAFTGGFSAGFFNTVGSLEGWTPSEFKSSRGEKQKHVSQNPEDFMDDEDMGEFGFAPQTIRATKDFDTSKKRKRKVFSDGPIPGEPVLHTLLTAGNDTVGYLLLKNIGMKEKMNKREEEISSGNKVYGCQMPESSTFSQSVENKDYELSDFYQNFLNKPKNDSFGLGYVGLSRTHVNLFKSSDLVVHDKNKKLSIRGQAFGVGAFENDDDDIYAKEDMSNYDFEMTKEKTKKQSEKVGETVFGIFIKSKVNSFKRELYPPPIIPKSFTGKHKIKKSRFEPLDIPKSEEKQVRNMTATSRAELLGEETTTMFTSSKSLPPRTNSIPTFVQKEEQSDSSGKKSAVHEMDTSSTKVKKESTFDPSNIWTDRFVSAAQDDDATNPLTPVKKYESDHYSKEMKDAARLKMFGPLTRISQDWQPCSLLCKRFNVPEPMVDKPKTQKERTRTKNLIFQYQKHHEENAMLKPGLTQVSCNTSENQELASSNIDTEESSPQVEVKQELQETNAEDSNKVVNKSNTEEQENNTGESKEIVEENKNHIVDITDKLNIEEKLDLFKAVFLSSSESEDDEEEEDTRMDKNNEETESTLIREQELKSNILGEELILPKIKPVKEGILSGLNFKNFNSITKQTSEESKEENKLNESNVNIITVSDPEIYGPKLPEKKTENDMCVRKDGYNVLKSTNSSSDEWVEKDRSSVKHKKKKHKKDKSSHKKKHKYKKSKK